MTCDIEETELIFDDDQKLISVNAINQEIHPKGFFVTIDHNPITNSFRKSSFGELLLRKKLLQKLGIVPDLAQGANVYPPIEFDHGELNETNKVGLEFILKLHKFQTDQNKRLVVFLIPYNFYVGEYGSYVSPEAAQDIRENQYLPKTIMRWCQTNGVECANPIPYFKKLEREGTRLYFRYDDHWNKAGHAAAAEVLYDYLSETYEKLN